MTHQSAKPSWEHYDHRADIGVRGFGPTLAEAFSQAALAMTSVITDPGKIEPTEAIEIDCDDGDTELLFVDWLNRIVYEMATRKMLFSQFDVKIDGRELHAVIRGEAIDMDRHQPTVEIKGATYTTLKVEHSADGGWMAQTVVDV